MKLGMPTHSRSLKDFTNYLGLFYHEMVAFK